MNQELQLGKYEFYPYKPDEIRDVRAGNGLKEMLMDEKLKRLLAIGFTIAGRWVLSADGRIDFDPQSLDSADDVLYAFVVDGELMYIGKTTKGLTSRMSNYKNAHSSQPTNTRNQKRIRECLLRNQSVEIYVLPDNGLLKYGGFHINLATGLEDSLIKELNPPWNGGRKETEGETLVTVHK
jgi:GIY-YIG catalytic domain.